MQSLTNKGTIQAIQRVTKLKVEMAVTKPTMDYLLFTSNVIRDANTGKWSYINLFDTIIIPNELESLYQAFSIVGRIDNVPAGDAETEVILNDPQGKEFAKVTMSGKIEKGDVHLVAEFPLVKFDEPGPYSIQVTYNGKEVILLHKYVLKVEKQTDGISR